MSSTGDSPFPDFGIPRSEIVQLINNRYHHTAQANNARLGPSEADLAARIQELKEMRQRASQMENTMRWWAKCTVMWRDKWRAVRNERNQARTNESSMRKALYAAREELLMTGATRDKAQARVKELQSRLHGLELGERTNVERPTHDAIPASVDKHTQTNAENDGTTDKQ